MRERQYNAAIAGLIGIAPQDEIEGMIAAHPIAAHNATMECYRRAMIDEQTLEGRRDNLSQANKLSRTYFVDVRRTLPCLWWSGVRLRSTAAVRSRANRPCLAAFALLGGLARGTEKGGRRGTQGNGA